MAPLSEGRVLRTWLKVFACMAFIFIASTGVGAPSHTSHWIEPLVRLLHGAISYQQFERIHYAIRKSAHGAEYALLAALLLRAVRFSEFRFLAGRFVGAATFAWSLAALFAATDEFHQTFVPQRHASLYDVGIDIVGASVGIALYTLIRQVKKGSTGAPLV